MVFNGLHAERRGNVALAGARAADQDHIVSVFNELAAMKLAHQGFVGFARGKIEAAQILVDGEARRLDLIPNRANLALGGLGLEQLREDRDR